VWPASVDEPEVAWLLWMRVQLKEQRTQNVAQEAEIQLQSDKCDIRQINTRTGRRELAYDADQHVSVSRQKENKHNPNLT